MSARPTGILGPDDHHRAGPAQHPGPDVLARRGRHVRLRCAAGHPDHRLHRDRPAVPPAPRRLTAFHRRPAGGRPEPAGQYLGAGDLRFRGGNPWRPVRVLHRPADRACAVRQGGFALLQEALRHPVARLLREARSEDHHHGPVRPDRADVHARAGRGVLYALPGIPGLRHRGRHPVGRRGDAAGLLPRQRAVRQEQLGADDPADRLLVDFAGSDRSRAKHDAETQNRAR